MDTGNRKIRDTGFNDLKNDAEEVERASKLVQKDIDLTRRAIEDSEAEIRQKTKEVDEMQVKIAIIGARSKSLAENNRILEELSNRIEARSQKWIDASRGSRETTYFSKGKGTGADDGTDLEPACNRTVRLACRQIMGLKKRQLIKDTNEGASYDADYDISRDELWAMLEELRAEYPAKEVFNSLCQNTSHSSTSLASKTKQLNLDEDANELRFKFEAGKLKDISEQPVLLRSVDQLIEQGQSAHFQRFLEGEKAKNDSWKGTKRFEKAQQTVNNLLHKKYGSNTNELNLKRRVLNLETELYGLNAATAYAKEVIADLESQRTLKKHEEQLLNAKFRKIQDFEAKAQRNQLMIQALVKENGSARGRNERQQREVLSYLKNRICTFGAEIDAMVARVQQSISKEFNQFSSLALSKLKGVDLQSGSRLPLDEMSINRLEGLKDDKTGSVIKAIMTGLEFPSYSAPEELLSRVKEQKEIATALGARGDFALNKDIRLESADLLERVSDIQEKCQLISTRANKKKIETAPLLKKSFSIATDALKDCLDLEDLINAWWDQPAQFLVPWMREDGLSLREWHAQWDVDSARLTQMQLLS